LRSDRLAEKTKRAAPRWLCAVVCSALKVKNFI